MFVKTLSTVEAITIASVVNQNEAEQMKNDRRETMSAECRKKAGQIRNDEVATCMMNLGLETLTLNINAK